MATPTSGFRPISKDKATVHN